jgi:hypothetical protein
MLGYVPSRAWTYKTTQGATTTYFGIYADPTAASGVTVLVLFCAVNNQTNCTSPTPFVSSTALGAVGVQALSNGYLLNSFASTSNAASGLIPGAPLLVPNSLQFGQSWNPLAGSAIGLFQGVYQATATVTAVGTVPGMSACPNSPTQGATVTYTVNANSGTGANGQQQSLSFVPGCGITDFLNTAGQEFTLVSVGTQNLGTQGLTRAAQSATMMGTLRAMWQRLLVKPPN